MPSSIPSLRFHFLTPFYDTLFRVLLPEKKIRQTLLEIGSIEYPEYILELGCGTGNFTILLSQKFLKTKITAIDMDENALSILSKKISLQHLKNINIQRLSATQLPFNNESFDAVYSSFLFCNLNYDEKLKTIEEAKRVLKNEGQFLIADWSNPKTLVARIGFNILQRVGGKVNTEDMKQGKLKNYLENAGFAVKVFNNINTFFGTILYYQATKIK